MCISCVKERCPDRGTTCLDGGTYLLNYNMCSQCQKKSPLDEKDLIKEETDCEETVSYRRILAKFFEGPKMQSAYTGAATLYLTRRKKGSDVCRDCGHMIATHEYSFSHDDDSQDYSMECDLCGHGMDTVNIIPDDNF